jgi:hypothetical protein
MNVDELAILEAALTMPDTNVVVRNTSAIVELHGPLPLRRGGEWFTLGEEGRDHLHVKMSEAASLRFDAPGNANAHLDLLASGDDVILRIAFRKTNPEKASKFEGARLAEVEGRFGHLRRGRHT